MWTEQQAQFNLGCEGAYRSPRSAGTVLPFSHRGLSTNQTLDWVASTRVHFKWFSNNTELLDQIKGENLVFVDDQLDLTFAQLPTASSKMGNGGRKSKIRDEVSLAQAVLHRRPAYVLKTGIVTVCMVSPNSSWQ